MRNSRARATLAECLIAMTATLAFNAVPPLIDHLASDAGVALAPRDSPAQPDRSIVIIDDVPSVCCADFNTGFGVALFGVLAGGFPLSLLGISVGARVRRGKSAPAERWARWFYRAFVVQAGSAACAALLFVLAAWEALTSPFGAEGVVFAALFLPTLICGAVALPSWHSMATAWAGPGNAMRLRLCLEDRCDRRD